LQAELELTYLFISHSLNVVRHIADRIAVMYLGNLVEIGSAEQVFAQPQHPYTRALVSANPLPDPDAPLAPVALKGEPPSPLNPPPGCRFHTRCPSVFEPCRSVVPAASLTQSTTAAEHRVWCHLYRDAKNAD
jgi:oligopeptide/dipeptide ABC transporter ATP-binding protein